MDIVISYHLNTKRKKDFFFFSLDINMIEFSPKINIALYKLIYGTQAALQKRK